MADEYPATSPNQPPFEIAEDEYTPCPCAVTSGGSPWSAITNCPWCLGSGYRLTRRLMRPVPRPDFSEQQALAMLKAKDAIIRKAVNTIEHAAELFLKLCHPKEAAQTKAAAKALQESLEG